MHSKSLTRNKEVKAWLRYHKWYFFETFRPFPVGTSQKIKKKSDQKNWNVIFWKKLQENNFSSSKLWTLSKKLRLCSYLVCEINSWKEFITICAKSQYFWQYSAIWTQVQWLDRMIWPLKRCVPRALALLRDLRPWLEMRMVILNDG